MTLSLRRFPDRIVRRRQAPGDRNSAGEFVPGATTDTVFRASVQPLKLADADIAGGVQLAETFKIYIAEPDALAAAFDDYRQADTVRWNGATYTVVESRSWPHGHTRATILRET